MISEDIRTNTFTIDLVFNTNSIMTSLRYKAFKCFRAILQGDSFIFS
ncbi:hypothetical protein PMAG_a4200 [Pseudoalteromonas mariniglutinosa NCIMB 1770]|nr:hypothetical protein [Pseudoalteromonas mariniglutinosa NCIMB 1770]